MKISWLRTTPPSGKSAACITHRNQSSRTSSEALTYCFGNRFGIADGLADNERLESDDGSPTGEPRVTILDPAVGTGTFLCEIIAHIRHDLEQQGIGGTWPQYVKDDLIPRLNGFEFLIAPYVICQLNLAMELSDQDDAIKMSPDQRINVFLTNTLEAVSGSGQQSTFASMVVNEAKQADAVKQTCPVMVIVGNPPYSGHSANTGDWIVDLMHGRNSDSPGDYFSVDGSPLGERNSRWFSDDYVKFIRFGQWRIERTGEGILAFVTNHGYLDAPTFRGMRASLMDAFDEIRVLDLHGSVKRGREST